MNQTLFHIKILEKPERFQALSMQWSINSIPNSFIAPGSTERPRKRDEKTYVNVLIHKLILAFKYSTGYLEITTYSRAYPEPSATPSYSFAGTTLMLCCIITL